MSTSAFSVSNYSSCPSSESDNEPTSTRKRRSSQVSRAKRAGIRSGISCAEQGMMGSAGMNKSCYRGVSYDKKKRKWRVQIKVATLGKSGVSVGYFDTEEDAARAYDRAAISLLGRSSTNIVTNFPLGDYVQEEIPNLIGKDRSLVKLALRSERIKRSAPRRRHAGKQRTSRFQGVSACARRNQWQARIAVEGKITHLGYFGAEEEAARAFDRISLALHGATATTNFAANNYADQDIAPFRGLGREALQRMLGVLVYVNEDGGTSNESETGGKLSDPHTTPECSSVNTLVCTPYSHVVAPIEQWQPPVKRARLDHHVPTPQRPCLTPPLSAFLPEEGDSVPLLLDMVSTDTLVETALWADTPANLLMMQPPATLPPSAYATPWTEHMLKSDSLYSESFHMAPGALQRGFQGAGFVNDMAFAEATPPCAMLLDGLLHCGVDDLMTGLVPSVPMDFCMPMQPRMSADHVVMLH